MLYDMHGNVIPDLVLAPPAAGRAVEVQVTDRQTIAEQTPGLTPADVTRILDAANQGDVRLQAKLAQEIEEKDWDIAQALQTRRLAVQRVAVTVEPADDTPAARALADDVDGVLQAAGNDELLGLNGLLAALLTALVPGYAVCETVWQPGGAGIVGWQAVPQEHFTLIGSRHLRLVTQEQPQGMDLPRHKFVVHRSCPRGGALHRAGLIRPLAWLYAFKRANTAFVLRYLEKYGMPFLLAQLDDHAWATERGKVASLVQNFGYDGGAVLTKAVDVKLLEGGTGNAGQYLEFQSYLAAAIAKVVLGQTSTSDSTDSNRSTAAVHNEVRTDLRDADCESLAETLAQQVIHPLVTFLRGPAALAIAPRLQFATVPEEDRAAQASVLQTLKNAGLEVADATEASERFGWKLTKAVVVPGFTPVSAPAAGAGAAAPDAPANATAAGLNGAQLSSVLEILNQLAAGTLAVDTAYELVIAAGMDPVAARRMVTAQRAAKPLTTNTAQLAADPTPALDAVDPVVAAAQATLDKDGAVAKWLAPITGLLDSFAGLSDSELMLACKALPAQLPHLFKAMDAAPVAAVLTDALITAAALGQAQQAAAYASRDTAQLAAGDPPATPSGLLTFDAAQRWLGQRKLLPTDRNSTMLALSPDFPAQAKARAMFSAGVTQVNVLQALSDEAAAFARGDYNVATARARLKTFLATQGFTPDDPITGAGGEINNLASTRRLDLIIRQNAGMAHAIGQREVAMHPDVLSRWPYYRYVTAEDERVRPAHKALNGLILAKDDPFWHSHTPPWGWNCRCALEDVDQEEADAAGVGRAQVTEAPNGYGYGRVTLGDGSSVRLPPQPTGFVFRPDQAFGDPDWSAIADGPLKDLLQTAFTRSLQA